MIEKRELTSQYKLTAAGNLKKMKTVRSGPTYIIFLEICSWGARGAAESALFGIANLA